MGLCASSEYGNPDEAAKNRRIQEKLGAEAKALSSVHKMLLLGAGESGKSTLFKQMKMIYGKDPFPEEDRIPYAQVICGNVIDSIKTLIDEAETYAENIPFEKKLKKEIDLIMDLDSYADEITSEVAESIDRLWKHPAVQETYKNRSKFYLIDSAKYYLDIVKDIGTEGYIPSAEHVLRSRARTTGVIEESFEIKGNTFTIYDVGGQRSERKKWIHCFESVTCVLFVAAISAYDTVLFEDQKQNRLVEAMDLFEEICNSRWFKQTTMILFLNKKDLFEDKVTRVPITACPYLEGYKGPKEYDACVDYIEEEFFQRNKSRKDLHVHVTTATDRENMVVVFEGVKETVIQNSLQAAGLVMMG